MTGKLWSDICEYFTQNKSTKNNKKANKDEQTIEFNGEEENRFKGIIYHLNKDKNKNICDEGIINVTANGSLCSTLTKNIVDFNSDNYLRSNTGNNYDSCFTFDFKEKKLGHLIIQSKQEKIQITRIQLIGALRFQTATMIMIGKLLILETT